MRILVTGCTGFAGGYLVEQLATQGAGPVFGLSRQARPAPHLAGKLAANLACDLADRAAIETVLREVKPDRIFHLAGYANVGRAGKEPDAAWAGNLTATSNLYEAVLQWGQNPRILYVSSGNVYGGARADEPLIDEDFPLNPMNAYARSKAAADQATAQYAQDHGLEIIRVRPFNHIGPRQKHEDAAPPDFARQIARVESGRQSTVQVGNLKPQRDFTDVRDMVRAYCLLMEQGKPKEVYNVGTGQAHSIQNILQTLVSLARVPIRVVEDPARFRPSDPAALRADAGKLRRLTGWTPQIPLSQSLRDILEYWRSAVAHEG